MVFGTVMLCWVKEMLEIEDGVTEQKGIISLANGGNPDTIHGDSKLRLLNGLELLIVGKFILPVTHQAFLKLHIGQPIAEPVS